MSSTKQINRNNDDQERNDENGHSDDVRYNNE